MNAMFVIKDLHKQVTWCNIKEDTLERNLMNVMLVTENSHVPVVYQGIKGKYTRKARILTSLVN